MTALTVLVTSLGYSVAMSEQSHEHDTAGSKYVYQQKFIPRQIIEIDLSKTAIFITDPQNDFISEG